MSPVAQEVQFDGLHCTLAIARPAHRTVLLKIAGTDVGEFGDAPMKALGECFGDSSAIHLFIDARDVRGASIAVSAEWAAWLAANKAAFDSITMLTGSRFIQITAEFVRRFSSLEGIMRICTDPAAFDDAFTEATRPGSPQGTLSPCCESARCR